MSGAPDPYPTIRLTVPHLRELLERVRNETLRYGITIVHATRPDEGEWILSNARARLLRGNLKLVGPEPAKTSDLVEQAARIGAQIVLAGEMRREDDARALRAAAAVGMRPVAYITAPTPSEAQMTLAMLGPWTNYDVALLTKS
jgi:hypothetical protein